MLTCMRIAFSSGRYDYSDEMERLQYQFDEMEMQEREEMGFNIREQD